MPASALLKMVGYLSGLHHRGLEVTERAGRDLPDGYAAARETPDVIFSCEIADDGS
jgi:hypothetical protein